MNDTNSQAFMFSKNYLQTVESTLDPEGNFLTCPIGLLMILSAFLGSGAPGGATASQISRALGLRPTRIEWQNYELSTRLYKTISESLENEVSETKIGKIYNVQLANALVLRKGYFPRDEFVNRLETNFDASLFEVNFANPTGAIAQINAWAKKESNGLISKLFNSPSEIDRRTQMILLNLFVFKDNWRTIFDRSEPGYFYSSPNRPLRIEMMNVRERMPVIRDTVIGFTAIKKPMRNRRFSFIIILPNKRFNIAAVNQMIFSAGSVKALFRSSIVYQVDLTMPKFHLDMKMNLEPTSKRMGVVDLFSHQRANLSGITEKANLFVTALEQMSVLHVDEYGVEAAAVTYMSISPTSYVETISFEVNQPFGCMIYDESLDIPLFVARVFNPKQ